MVDKFFGFYEKLPGAKGMFERAASGKAYGLVLLLNPRGEIGEAVR